MATRTAASKDVVDAIRRMDEEFMRNVQSKDAERLVTAFYAEDAQFFVPNQSPLNGRPAILAAWKGLLPGVQKLVLDTQRVEASADLAYGTGVYRMALASPDGSVQEDEGKYVVVYRREFDGRFLATADIFNSSRPAP